MKKHFSKRLTALFLAVVLLATSAPVIAYAYNKGESSADTKYLFAYFTSNSQYGQQIRFAVSEDGYNYQPLNYNRPIISHEEGTFNPDSPSVNTQLAGSSETSSGYARDPYIFKGSKDDGYYLVATDMDASSGGMHESWAGDTNLVFWHSDDLVNWYQISIFDVADKSGFETTIRAWAPQVIYDSSVGRYMVFWSNYLGNWDEAIYYSYTDDFINFDDPKVLYKASQGAAIDGDIVEYNGKYYLFYKDENNATVGYVTSDSLTGTYSNFTDCTMTDQAVEGNSMYNIAGTDTWILMLDEYVNGSFVFQITNDFENYELMSTDDYSLDGFSPRHGSVVQITNDEYQALLDAYTFTPEIGTTQYVFSNEYTFSGNGWNWQGGIDDGSGNTFDATINASSQNSHYGATTTPYLSMSNGELSMYCSEVAINNPAVEEKLFSQNFTITFDYIKKSEDVSINGEKVFDFSKRPIISVSRDANNDLYTEGLAYIYLLNDGTLAVYAGDGNYNTKTSDRIPLEGEEISYTLTYDGKTLILYMDYVEVARIDTPNGIPEMPVSSGYMFAGLGFDDVAGNTTGIYGTYKDLTFYDRAFTATEAHIDLPLNLDSLEACVSSFEDIVTSGNIYMNTPEAYKCYKEAQRLIEVRDYGTVNVDAEMAECTQKFIKAIDDLILWTPDYQSNNRYTSYMGQEQIQGNIIASDGDSLGAVQNQSGWQPDADDIAAGINGELANDGNAYEIRYAYKYRRTGIFGGGNYVWDRENVAMSVYGDSYIALYDGENETSFPIKVRYFRDDSNTGDSRGLENIYLANSNLTMNSQEDNALYLYSLNDNEANATDFFWPSTYMHKVANSDVRGSGFNDTNEQNIHQYGYFSAVLNSDAFSNSDSNLLIVNPNVVFTDMDGNKLSFGNNGISSNVSSNSRGGVYSYTKGEQSNEDAIKITSDEIGAIADGNSATYYIINVEPIRTALEQGAKTLTTSDLSLISESDMYDALVAADNMMKYNPYQRLTDLNYRNSNYVDKNRMQEAAQTIADEVEDLVNNYTETVSYIDNDGYASLNALRTNVDINAMYYSNNSEGFTIDSWNEFKKAYEASVDKVNELVTNPFEDELNEDGTRNETITDIVEAVYQTYYKLRHHANFDKLREAINDKNVNDTVTNGVGGYVGSADEQTYTIGSWLDVVYAYQNAVYFEENNDELNIAMYDGYEQEIETNGYKFTVEIENPQQPSELQQKSYDLYDKVYEKINNLTAPAPDYSVYDAFMEIYATQDMNAFEQSYLEQETSIKGLADKNGTKYDAPEYSYEEGATAYATYNGHIYYNAPQESVDGTNISLDSIITDMFTELNTANNDQTNKRKSYTVTFEVYKNDQYVATVKDAELHYYGDTVLLNANENGDLGDLTCYKWVVTSLADNGGQSSEKVITNVSNEYTVRIQSDSVIKAYCSDSEQASEAVPVTIKNQYSRDIQTLYLSPDAQITLGAKSVNTGNETYNIQDMPFYEFTGWKVNDSNYSFDTYTVSELAGEKNSITIQPVYRITDANYTITLDGEVIFDGIGYDDCYTVKADEDAYAILIKQNDTYSVASYGNSYKFFANRDMDFYTLTKSSNNYYINGILYNSFTKDELYRLDNMMPFVYSSPKASGDNGDKFTTFSAYSAGTSSDVKITEVGTLYTTDQSLGTNAEAFVYGGNGVSFIKSKVQGEDSKQYSLTFSGAEEAFNSGTTVYTRAYVKYSYTYMNNGKQTTVQTIVYGNIVSDSAIFQ